MFTRTRTRTNGFGGVVTVVAAVLFMLAATLGPGIVSPPPVSAASPVAVDDTLTIRQDLPAQTVDVLANDSDADVDDTLIITSNTPAAHGTATCSNFDCEYTSEPGYIGPDSFTYTIDDGNGGTDSATVDVTVTENVAPVAFNQSAQVNGNESNFLALNADDADFSDIASLDYTITDGPDHGSLTDCSFGDCFYTPSPGYTGPDSFTWKANDGLADSNEATYSLTVNPTSVTTVANNDTGANALGGAAIADAATLTSAHFEAVTSGTPNGTSTGLGVMPTDGSTFALLTSGGAHLADNVNNSGATGISNGGGNVRGDTDLDVTILRLNLIAPAGTNCLRLDFVFLSEEYPEYVGTAYNDTFIAELDTSTWTTSGSDILAPESFALDPLGQVVSINSTGQQAMSLANAAGTTYDGATALLRAATQASPGDHTLYLSILDQDDRFYDSAVFVDNIRFVRVADPEADCADGAVVPTNTPPVASDDSAATGVGEAVAINVLANDSDPDDDPLTVTTPTPTADHGTVSCTTGGVCTYTPAAEYSGPDSFEYSISDGQDGAATATVSVTVVHGDPFDPTLVLTPSHGYAGQLFDATYTEPGTDCGSGPVAFYFLPGTDQEQFLGSAEMIDCTATLENLITPDVTPGVYEFGACAGSECFVDTIAEYTVDPIPAPTLVVTPLEGAPGENFTATYTEYGPDCAGFTAYFFFGAESLGNAATTGCSVTLTGPPPSSFGPGTYEVGACRGAECAPTTFADYTITGTTTTTSSTTTATTASTATSVSTTGTITTQTSTITEPTTTVTTIQPTFTQTTTEVTPQPTTTQTTTQATTTQATTQASTQTTAATSATGSPTSTSTSQPATVTVSAPSITTTAQASTTQQTQPNPQPQPQQPTQPQPQQPLPTLVVVTSSSESTTTVETTSEASTTTSETASTTSDTPTPSPLPSPPPSPSSEPPPSPTPAPTQVAVVSSPGPTPTGGVLAATFAPPSQQPQTALSAFAAAVGGPNELRLDPDVVLTNLLLTIFVIILFAVSSYLFNSTMDENRATLTAWRANASGALWPITSPLLWLDRSLKRAVGRARLTTVARISVVLLLSALIYGFLDPNFGFNAPSLVLFVALIIGLGITTYLAEGGSTILAVRRHRVASSVKLLGAGIFVAIVCVLASRLIDFRPGFVFGFIASSVIMTPIVLGKRAAAELVVIPAILLLIASIIAWLLLAPIRAAVAVDPSWLPVLLETVAATTFIAGIEGLFFSMIPLSFMDGVTVFRWNKIVWAVLFGMGAFLFWQLVINREGKYLEAFRQSSVAVCVAILVIYGGGTLLVWSYFRIRKWQENRREAAAA